MNDEKPEYIKATVFSAIGVIGGFLFAVFIVAFMVIAAFFPDDNKAEKKWFEAREIECFAGGGDFAKNKNHARCIFRDGRIDVKEWKPIKP